MIRNISKLIFIFVLGVVFIQSAKAASTCTYARQNELNALANNINSSVTTEVNTKEDWRQSDEEDEATLVSVEYKTFMIQLLNITDDVYIVVKNLDTNKTDTYTSKDFSNGTLKFETSSPYVSVTYEIGIYSNDENCKGDLLRKIDITTPQINPYYYMSLCNGIESYYLCQEILNSSVNLSETQILNGINQYKNGLVDHDGNAVDPDDKKDSLVKPIHIVIVVSVIVFCIGAYFVVEYAKRRRSIV